MLSKLLHLLPLAALCAGQLASPKLLPKGSAMVSPARPDLSFNVAAYTCDVGERTCDTRYCMPLSGNCCGDGDGSFCSLGYYCVPGGCCERGRICSGPGAGCADDQESCLLSCMPKGKVCCSSGYYCDAGEICVGNRLCRPAGSGSGSGGGSGSGSGDDDIDDDVPSSSAVEPAPSPTEDPEPIPTSPEPEPETTPEPEPETTPELEPETTSEPEPIPTTEAESSTTSEPETTSDTSSTTLSLGPIPTALAPPGEGDDDDDSGTVDDGTSDSGGSFDSPANSDLVNVPGLIVGVMAALPLAL